MTDKHPLFNFPLSVADREALERVRGLLNERSGAATIRHLIRERDPLTMTGDDLKQALQRSLEHVQGLNMAMAQTAEEFQSANSASTAAYEAALGAPPWVESYSNSASSVAHDASAYSQSAAPVPDSAQAEKAQQSVAKPLSGIQGRPSPKTPKPMKGGKR